MLATAQAAFFVMLMDDRRGVDLYWSRQADNVTAAARSLAATVQPE
jgi:hypothetical protein